MVRLRYNGGAYWFRLASVSHWNGRAWERFKDVQSGEIDVPDGMILISTPDGEMQFMGDGGLMVEGRDPRDPPPETVTTPRESSWDKPVEIGGEWHTIGLSWGRRDRSHPFLSIDGMTIYPEPNEQVQTEAIIATEATLTRELDLV